MASIRLPGNTRSMHVGMCRRRLESRWQGFHRTQSVPPAKVSAAMPAAPPSMLIPEHTGTAAQPGHGWQVMVTAELLKLFPDLAKRF